MLNRWGDPLFAGAPAFKADASNGGADQARQIGYNHDGMHFFPIDGTDSATGSSVEGLMVTNHEYTTPEYFYPVGVVPGNAQWNLDWVRKSQHAHGVSVLHIRLNNGKWEPVLIRRSTAASTPMSPCNWSVRPPAAAWSRPTRTRPARAASAPSATAATATLWNTYHL